jgi:hypothetical protein
MRVSRRAFFERIRQAAERPGRWRERRVQELKEYALSKAPAEWTDAQRQDLARTVEEKLAYMSDDTLRDSGTRRYVDVIINARKTHYEAGEADEDSCRLNDPYYHNDYQG